MILMFKIIPNYENYEINECGVIRIVKTKKIKKQRIGKDNYYKINLYKDGKSKTFRVHRLVAELFIPNPNNYPIVNHIDGNKLNNHINNLEWCTYSENTKHAYDRNLGNMKETQLRASKLGAEKSKKKIAVYKDGIYIDTYESKQDCAKALNVNEKTVYNWLHKITNNTKRSIIPFTS